MTTVADVYGGHGMSEEACAALLDRSLRPRAPGMLYDLAGALGLAAGQRLLDLGCRDGAHTAALVERFRCAALGVDPVPQHIAQAQAVIAARGLAPRLAAVEGRAEAIPAAAGSFDAIWCRDVLTHVTDLDAAFRECARVLRPGGWMLVYQTFATPELHPAEAAFLCAALAAPPASLVEANVESAWTAHGFRCERRERIGSEWREAWEEDGSHATSGQLLRCARMRRNRGPLIAVLGQARYDAELAFCLWGVYQMLGKLCPTVTVLRRASA